MSEQTSSTTNSKKTLISEAVILAGFPAYIYLVTFEYEFGYCNHFGIPKELISPNLTSMLICAIAIIGLLISSLNSIKLFTVPFVHLLRATSKGKWYALNPLIGINTAFVVIMIFVLNIYGLSWKLFLGLVGAVVVVNLLLGGVPLLFHKGTITERIIKSAQAEPDDLIDVMIAKRFGYRSVLVGITLILSIFFAAVIGDGEARNKTKFLIIRSRPDTVVLRTYGDMMICAQFDKVSKTISNELVILYLSKFDELALSNEEIGPLTVKKKEQDMLPAKPSETTTPQTKND